MASTRDTINAALDKVFVALDETHKVIHESRPKLGADAKDKATDAIQSAASEMRVARNAIHNTKIDD